MSGFNLGRHMAETGQEVERTLERLLPEVRGTESRLFEAMRYACLGGGKRLRPYLVMASSGLFGVGTNHALRVAAAIECVHCYSLIHDDLPAMDDDDFRRGRPTVHKAYDDATAILAGDALLTLAFEIIADHDTHEDPQVRVALAMALAKAAGANGMVGGQMLDMLAEQEDVDIGAVTRLQRLKTGELFAFSCEAGAILGKSDPNRRNALRGFAHDMGLAFQIADDLLDVTGREEDVGKAVGKDAVAGKATFVSILGVERARDQAQLLADQAIRHLEIFDQRADPLRAVATFVVARRA
ncbi:MAG: polyprenyl synthetase family protein [Rhodospirillaceae bacterium]|nr:polyprenyl synthetase family protein [Rhodospirillaceae bacterium]